MNGQNRTSRERSKNSAHSGISQDMPEKIPLNRKLAKFKSG